MINKQLRLLVQIQKLALEIAADRAVIEGAPARTEEIEAHFRERNIEYVAIKDRHDEIQADQKARAERVKELEAQRDKFKANLMQVKNQREYTAVLQEIDSTTGEISVNEEAILRNMEELETLTGELKSHEEHINTERENVAREKAEIEQQVAVATERVGKLEAERVELESHLPASVVVSAQKLEANRQGVFISLVEGESCQSCFVRVRPQVVQEIKRGKKLHSCGNCKRFLYHPRLLAEDTTPANANASSAEATQTV